MNKDTAKNLILPFLIVFLGFGIISLSISLFSEISESVVDQQIKVFDEAVISLFELISFPLLYKAMAFITELGSVEFIALATVATSFYLGIKEKDRWGVLFLLISVGGGGLLIALLKYYYQIDRPTINEAIDAVGYSFPSGHSMGSLILYGFIIYLILRSKMKKTKKKILSVILICVISLIAVSRIYLSAHFPSDIVAGQAGGLAWLLTCIISLEAVKWKTRNNFKPLNFIKSLLEKAYEKLS